MTAENPVALATCASDSPERVSGKGRSDMRQIITVATMKGGSGKSTLASCLAVHWHLTGRAPTIIDADPQRSIARLAMRERALGGVPVVEDATADAWKTAQNLAASGRPIIIDTPGFRSQATLGVHRGGRFSPGPGQGITARCRPHARHAQFADRWCRRQEAELPLHSHADHRDSVIAKQIARS